MFVILSKSRRNFYAYDETKYSIVRECIKFLSKCEECNDKPAHLFSESSIDQYYMKKIYYNIQEPLFNFLFPNFSSEDYYKFVCILIEVSTHDLFLFSPKRVVIHY